MKRIENFLREENGQDVVEYSLLLVLIGAAVMLCLTQVGLSVRQVFGTVTEHLNKGLEAAEAAR